jgi:hypothetical protein
MRRPNTDSTQNMPVTLPRNELSIRYVVTSPVHTVTIRCYGTRNFTVCTQLYTSVISFDIKIDLLEVACSGGVEWIDLAEGRDEWLAIVNAVSNVRVSCDSGCLNS